MHLKFTKMHGLGNDFVVFNAIDQDVAFTPAQVRFIADRHFGIGCDQVLLVEKASRPEVDFRYRIYNADGSEVAQCGNGARCFARFVVEQGLTNKTEIAVETSCGVIYPRLETDGNVTVNMGAPDFVPARIPFEASDMAPTYPLQVGEQQLTIGAVSMGNPHAVLRVDHVDTALVNPLGAMIEQHPRFPQRVNVGFMQIVARDHIRLRVFERGAGETLACGTGACAAVTVGRQTGMLDDNVKVDLPGGRLVISWRGGTHPVYMTGAAVSVFEGNISL